MKSFLIGGGVVFTLLIILYVLVWAPRRATTHVERDADTLHTLSLPDVYEHVEESLMGQHYLRCRFTCGRRLTYQLQELYPFIERIYVRPDGAQRFIVSIDFLPPRLMFGLGDYRRASFNEMIYMISPQESRWSELPVLHLPRYVDGITDLTGIFFVIPEYLLAQRIQTIRDTLPSDTVAAITYLPGWEQVLIEYKNMSVYLHLLKDIDHQLAKLIDLEQFYEGFSSLRMIDLGSSEYVIVR